MSLTTTNYTGFSAKYTSPVIATASDWTGTASIGFASGVNDAVATADLVLINDELTFTFSAAAMGGFSAGVWKITGEIISASLGIHTYRVDSLTVTDHTVVAGSGMTIITMTIAKIDGTPSGRAIKELSNKDTGVTIVNGWKGITVTARVEDAYNIGTDIIGTETITTETNAAGYAQLAVIKGSTVTVSCPSFGKTVTVDTTGLDTIDLSTYF